MATLVSQPLQLTSALRCVEYKFNMPSVGVAPEEKKFIYRLYNETDSQYLTAWKEYPPTSNGQDISIDFVHDLRKILRSPMPNINAIVPTIDTNIIKALKVEYGERTLNTETCAPPVDVVDGITSEINVVNGIRRHQEIASQSDINFNFGIVLHDRAKRYSVSKDAADFLYVIGTKIVLISYYTNTNVFISSVQHVINQPYPTSVCTIIPIGFNIAPAGTGIIHVSASNTGTPDLVDDLLFTIDNNFFANESGGNNLFNKENRMITDLYFQNNFGAFDLMCFENIEQMASNVQKQEIIQKFDCNDLTYNTDQRWTINNNSAPVMTFRRTFNKPTNFHAQKWLNELAASGNVWVKENLDFGFSSLTPTLLKLQLTNSEVITRGGTSEFVVSGYYSEVFLYPY